MQILAKTELLNALNASMITQGNVNTNELYKGNIKCWTEKNSLLSSDIMLHTPHRGGGVAVMRFCVIFGAVVRN